MKNAAGKRNVLVRDSHHSSSLWQQDGSGDGGREEHGLKVN